MSEFHEKLFPRQTYTIFHQRSRKNGNTLAFLSRIRFDSFVSIIESAVYVAWKQNKNIITLAKSSNNASK